VPILVDGRAARLEGELVRVPAPARWPWALMVLLLASVLVVLAVARRRALRTVSLVVASVASVAAVVTAVSFALDTYASPGTWIAGLDEVFFVIVGAGVLAWGSQAAQIPAAIGLGLVSAAVGISKGAVFLHPLVLSVLPDGIARAFVALAIGGGVAAAVLGGASTPRPFAVGRPTVRRS
jgi:hypothetical protein